MRKIISIIQKNFKLIIRSRISALIILFGPLLIMLIVGLAFNSTSTIRINVGYFTPQQTNMTDSFVSLLESKYNIDKYDTANDCKLAISAGTKHICIIFPEGFAISDNRVNEIVFQVDNSKINLYETVVDSIEASFNERALQLTQGMTQELLDKLNQTQASISNKTLFISQLRDENQILVDDAGTIKDQVSDLDLDFDYSSLGMSDLESQTDAISKGFEDVKKIAEDAIDDSIDLIEDLEDEIDDLNLSSNEKEDLFDLMNTTEETMLDLKDDLNATGVEDVEDLTDIVDELKNELRSVDSKFSLAANARDVSVDKITNMNEKLALSSAKIIVIEEAFDQIFANIANTQITDLDTITSPIKKRVDPVVSEENQLNFYFPYLVVLITMFIGLLLSSTLVIMEKTSRAHFRNFVTPTSDMSFIFGAYITSLIIMSLQLVVVLSIFGFYFQKDIITNFRTTLMVLALLVTLFSWLGMALGNIFNTEETGTLASISIGSILLFVSDLIFPLERMPPYIADLARTYNPFVIGTEMLRKAIVHRIPVGGMGDDFFLIVAYLVILFAVLILSHKLMKRSYLLRWGGYIARRELRLQERLLDEGKLIDVYNNLDEKDFLVINDKKISNLKELLTYVDSLSVEEFGKSVTKDKNIFADWIEKTLKNDHLSTILRKTGTKANFSKALKKGIRSYDKIKQRLTKQKKK